jgi:two-component system, NarL family, response regulator NreC
MAERILRVFVLDAQQLVREAVIHLLGIRGPFEVAGHAGTDRETMELIPALDPDVAVVEISRPTTGGLEVVRSIREHCPRTEVVALSALHQEVQQRAAFEAGARGFVHKEAAFDQLVDAIRCAARGDFFLAGSVGRDVAAEYASPWVAHQGIGGHITPRERELAVLLADSYSSKEAAAILNISVRTADTHRASLMRKLDARNLADVVKYCIRNGLVGT